MAFTITTFNFAKRANSTKQPTGLSGTDWSVVLKEKTSYDQPVFLLTSNSQPEFNYLQWGSWYYFVTGISYVRNDLYEVSCDLDVLATYKAQIGATTAFVKYDTTPNTEIPDGRLSNKTSTTYAVAFSPGSFNMFEASQCIVVGIVGQDSTNHWAMSAADANALLDGIDNWMDNISLKWPEYDEPDREPDDSEEPGSNSEDPGHGPGTIYG